MADGLATRQAFKLPTEILRELIDDFILVSDEHLKLAIKIYIKHARTIAEGAGAASLAAAIKLKDKLKGQRVGLVLSGGNLTFENILSCLK
jgi:threonine dehydratase